MKIPKNTIIYARYSPRPNASESESNENQIAACKELCRKKGWPVVGVWQDYAVSGKEEDRPALWEAIESLVPGMVLLVYRYDRLARSVFLSELIRREVEKKKAVIHAVNGNVEGETPEAALQRQILQAFSEYERQVTAIRTKLAMRRYQGLKRSMSSKPPLGFEIIDGRLEIVPEEIVTVRKISELTLEGWGKCRITNFLNKNLHIYKPRGKVWWTSTVKNTQKRIEENELYKNLIPKRS